MATLLQLFHVARGSPEDATSEDHLAQLIRFADENPENEGAQVLAAHKAWLHRKNEVAQRLAERAERTDGMAFPALVVLAAISAESKDDDRTYRYAKRLASATRHDKAAGIVIRALAWIRLVGVRGVRNKLDYQRVLESTHDEWVAWAKEFVASYETAKSDA
ncbi:hypothetical protein ACPOLB_23535 [Rubrivivax sp. RP6-9]|uniref:hypothetical protein n=1 Tax=Rubrivivax sp. RP6-9 TaxID=3415750 RepID=UPI003CC6B357